MREAQLTPSGPLVSIAMPVHNAAYTLRLAINSILLQTYTNWELILIDDGSSDGTLAVAHSYVDPRIKVIWDGRNKGMSDRLNQVLDMCHGEYFARLDADDVAYPERLERQVMFLEENRDIDLLGTGAMVFGRNGVAIGTFPMREKHEEICSRPWSGFYLAHPTWMGRTEWFRRYRYYSGAMGVGDQELLLRSYESSRFQCLPEVLTGYRLESLYLPKLFSYRYHFSKALAREALRRRKFIAMVSAVGKQAAKGLADAVAILSGHSQLIMRHRALPASEKEIKDWEQYWARCTATVRDNVRQCRAS